MACSAIATPLRQSSPGERRDSRMSVRRNRFNYGAPRAGRPGWERARGVL